MRLLLIFLAVPTTVLAQVDVPGVRVIKPCLAVDGESPPPRSLIMQAMQKVSSEFESNVGVVFEKTAPVLHDGNFERSNFDQLIYLIGICPPGFEMAVLFTNRARSRVFNLDTTFLAGESSAEYGIVTIYDFQFSFQSFSDAGGNPAAVTVLKHEIGHLFGLRHQIHDPDSFMYTPSHKSRGLWTKEIKEAILRNKNKRWLP